MMKTKKFRVAVLVALVLVLTGMLMLSGCDKGDQTTEIYITKSDMPRVNYVEGQELDLSAGRLTIVTGGQEQKLPLTAAEITISGYDKTKVGQQTLTIQYGQVTTTMTVTVAARAVAENFETMYFVGDVFNKKVGKIRITTDDSKQFTVNMNDDKVSVTSFDSSKAGQVTVTLCYADGQNTYYCQFPVLVYEESNVEFTAPTKTRYNSYDDGIEVSGGHFTVTSADGKLTKHVPLSAEMISGFDLAAATMENRTQPLRQVVTAEYLGRGFEFEVHITFGGISVVNYHAQNVLNKIDWEDAKQNGFSAEVNADALDAILTYCELTEEQAAKLSDDVRLLVACAGAVAAMSAFQNELANFQKTIAMDAQNRMYFICESYEQTVADLEILSDPNAQINVLATLLRRILEEFGTTPLDQQMMIGDLVRIYDVETETAILETLRHMIYLHELMSKVPADWTVDGLAAYGEDLLVAAMAIYNAGYYKNGYANYYQNILSAWREKGDVFDILYSYFMYVYDGGDEFMNNYMWGSIPLPGKVEEWYRALSSAVSYENYYYTNGASDAFLADVSAYWYYYYQTLELAEQIKNSGNQLWIDVYTKYDGDFMNRMYLYSYTCGYLQQVSGMVDSEAFGRMLDSYYQVMKLYFNQELKPDNHQEEVTAMFAAFQQLSPTELMGFLSALNYNYVGAKGGLPMLSTQGEEIYNLFCFIVKECYMTYLHEAGRPLLANLMLAMECYALREYKDTALDEFTTMMQQIAIDYEALSVLDKANFDQYAGVAYNRYMTIYQIVTSTKSLTLTAQEQALFAELEVSLQKFFTVYQAIAQQAQAGQQVSGEVYAVAFALYSRVNELYQQLLAIAGEDAVYALYTNTYEMMDGRVTVAQAYYEADRFMVMNLSGQLVTVQGADGTVDQITLWDAYVSSGVAELMADMSEMLFQAYFCEKVTVEKDYLVALMNDVRELSLVQKSLLPSLCVDMAYYKALNASLLTVLSESANNVKLSEALCNAEIAFINYAMNPDNAEAKANFMDKAELLVQAYKSATDADKAYLEAAYEYYYQLLQQEKAA